MLGEKKRIYRPGLGVLFLFYTHLAKLRKNEGIWYVFFLSLLLCLVYIDLVGYFTCHIFRSGFFLLEDKRTILFSSYARKGKSELL